MTQTDFISQLASKLGRPTPTDPPPANFQVPEYRLSGRGERAAVFLQNWQALGGHGEIVKNVEETVTCLKKWFGDFPQNWTQLNPQAILAWDSLPSFAESAFSSLAWPVTRYSQAASDTGSRYVLTTRAELGVTGADWGIALSGTIVTNSSPQRGRAVSLLPPRHLTFIEASKLRDNLSEVLEEAMASGNPPSAIEMISGPSRTSDIEMDLSIGVHGPIEVYAIVIDD